MERKQSYSKQIQQNKAIISSDLSKFKNQSIRAQINPNFFKQQISNTEKQNDILFIDTKISSSQLNDLNSQQLLSTNLNNQTSLKTVTSDKPLKLAWIFDQNDLENLKFKQSFREQIQTLGKLALSQCPGKKIERGRDGKKHDRDIFKDVENYRSQGITLIICLLNDSELRSLGVKVQDYQKACEIQGIELFKYPIIEMAPPDDIQKFHTDVIEIIIKHLITGQGNVLMHCRGGVGRAGLLACCILSNFCEFTNSKKIIEFMRKRRDKRCVESRKQEDFVKSYYNFINQQK